MKFCTSKSSASNLFKGIFIYSFSCINPPAANKNRRVWSGQPAMIDHDRNQKPQAVERQHLRLNARSEQIKRC
jgi:hypothetical protein